MAGKKIGLIDVDSHNYPNIPLMKISAYHKACGDEVEWYHPVMCEHFDKVYISKIFSFTEDYQYYVNADEIVKGGTGYCISVKDGKEVYDNTKDIQLPEEIEHFYPDYGLYGVTDTAYGFLTRGCPRNCGFCHVTAKEGCRSVKVADLSEFWHGQKNIVLCDPNILACKDWRELLQQLIDSKAKVDINQGLDIRLMTEETVEMIKKLRVENIHFAWDNYRDKDIVVPKFREVKKMTGWGARKLGVYVLTNFDSTFDQDLERVYTLRDLGYDPYVMVYDREHTKGDDQVRLLQRYVNNRKIFNTVDRFEDYDPKMG